MTRRPLSTGDMLAAAVDSGIYSLALLAGLATDSTEVRQALAANPYRIRDEGDYDDG